jgi:hypothetical protein
MLGNAIAAWNTPGTTFARPHGRGVNTMHAKTIGPTSPATVLWRPGKT